MKKRRAVLSNYKADIYRAWKSEMEPGQDF